jgi:hypothetical protein
MKKELAGSSEIFANSLTSPFTYLKGLKSRLRLTPDSLLSGYGFIGMGLGLIWLGAALPSYPTEALGTVCAFLGALHFLAPKKF